MSWEVDKEYTESTPQYQPEPPFWKKTWKYFVVGVICFSVGFSISNNRSKYFVKRNQTLTTENHELKEKIRKYERTPAETVLVPYTVLVTEAVKESKEAAPVTDAPVEETAAQIETDAPDNEYQVKVLSNPLTKIQPYKVKPAAPAMYTVYWIDVKRSDLASMKSSDFQFFLDHINKEYKTDDIVNFYIRITDFPDIIIDCPVSDYEEDTMYVCHSKYDDTTKCDVAGYTACEMDVSDPDKITLTGYKKDEYGLPLADENEVYSFSEFSESLWSRLTSMHESAKFLFG